MGRDLDLAVLEVELDVVGGLVRAHRHAADRVEELGAVDLEDVGVVLRDDLAVFRELADDQAADHHRAAEGEDHGGGVEGDLDVLVVLVQDGLQHARGLLVQDEGGLLGGLELAGGVADELMGVGGHERGALRVHVEEDTVHRGTHLVVCGGVNRAPDAFRDHGSGDGGADGVAARALDLRVVRGREIGEGGITVAPDALEGAFAGGLDRDGLVGQGLQQVHHLTGGHGDAAFFGNAVHGHDGAERELLVGGGDLQLSVLEDEEEVLQDGEGGLGGNRLGNIENALEQSGARNVEFHISLFKLFE